MRTGTLAGVVLLALVMMIFMGGCGKEEGTAAKPKTPAAVPGVQAAEIAQKTCPVMGGAIDKSVYVDYEGRRIYFCCTDCLAAFKKEPAKYVAKVDEELKAQAPAGK